MKVGWIFIDKPKEISSFEVIRKLRKILNIKKIGHAGTLDPFATGVLAVALGEATKSISYFNASKFYQFRVLFGISKDTDDPTGKTLRTSDAIPSKKDIDVCLKNFIGFQQQVPPRYSAVKINGKRAYKLARENKTFEIKSKEVNIQNLTCSATEKKEEFIFTMECSSGTYVRSFARDLGKMLNTFAHVSELRRIKIGKFGENNIILLDNLAELVHIGDHFEMIHSIQDVLDDIPAVQLNSDLCKKFRNGLNFDYFNEDIFEDTLLIISDEKLLGIGKVIEGKIKPVRVFNL
jgi:tRNA pseudouridine55 synthase